MTLPQIVGQFELVSQRQVEPLCFGKGQILPNILTASNMKFVKKKIFYREYFFSANASAAMAFLTCPWNDELLLVVMVMMLVV